MIVIRVELWPQGDEAKKKEIANAVIANDGSGTNAIGNYNATFQDRPGIIKDAVVLGHKRQKESVWQLIKKALINAYDKGVEVE